MTDAQSYLRAKGVMPIVIVRTPKKSGDLEMVAGGKIVPVQERKEPSHDN